MQALALLAERTVDLAVLDVHLPDMNGLDVCAAIKADPRTASTPVVHISAVAVEPQDRTAGLDGGADAYLIDPIEPQEMLATVRSLLRSAGARRTAERLAVRLDRLSAASLRINVAMKPPGWPPRPPRAPPGCSSPRPPSCSSTDPTPRAAPHRRRRDHDEPGAAPGTADAAG